MTIVNSSGLSPNQFQEAAQILTGSLPLGWPTIDDARKELQTLLSDGSTLLAATEAGSVIGIGGILKPIYDGNVTELHPLAVRADRRRQGVGRMLVTALENEARKQGCTLLYLGADDEREGGETSLANTDLFDNLPKQLAAFSPGTHQAAFYLKLGFTVIGVMPDANGPGKPDILMAKRL